jgi:hypothetical protein
MSLIPAQEFRTNRPRLSLDGEWQFSYDPGNVGLRKQWFLPRRRLPEKIQVPGCPQTRRYASAGKAMPDDKPYIPEMSLTIMLRYPSLAPSWWKRSFFIPEEWRGKRIWLHLGGICPSAEVWVNGRPQGHTLTSRSPVRCDITNAARFNEKNEVALRLEWPEGPHLNGVWNCTVAWTGLYRSVWIEAVSPAHIADVHIVPSIHPPAAQIRTTLVARGRNAGLKVVADISPAGRESYRGGRSYRNELLPDASVPTGLYAGTVDMPGSTLWSVDNPSLHQARVRLFDGDTLLDEASVRFGLREITTRQHQVLLNGTPVFLRGGCDDMLHPETVCPPADKEFYRRHIRLAKQYGFNYTKSCVEVFTKEYLDAADEEGYLVCQEMPFGLHGRWREARFRPPSALRRLHRQELGHIVRHSRNHPSVILYSMASELGNAWRLNKASFTHFSRDLPAIARSLSPRTLVTDCTGESGVLSGGWCRDNELIAVNQPLGLRNTDLQCSSILWSGVFDPFFARPPIVTGASRPFVFHEYCWITSLSDPGLIRRFARLPIKPLMIREMVDLARRNGQAKDLPAMIAASRNLKLALRKHTLEVARMEPCAAGYHHWLVQDWVHAAEGVFNEFWEAPRDLSAKEFRQCNADTVLCLEETAERCFVNGESATFGVRISHFGPRSLSRARLRWRLLEGSRSLASGAVAVGELKPGELRSVAPWSVRLPPGDKPRAMILCVALSDGDGQVAENRWRIWSVPAAARKEIAFTVDKDLQAIFPDLLEQSAGTPGPSGSTQKVRVERRLTDELISWVGAGGGALFLADRRARESLTDLPRAKGADIPMGYEYQYRTVPYNLGAHGNMGTLIHDHPALGHFPHEGWCDFVFQPLLEGAAPIALAPFRPARIRPIIRSIGHMASMEDKAYLFEVSVGRGRLVVCAMNLAGDQHPWTSSPRDAAAEFPAWKEPARERSPAARYLLEAMLTYLRRDRLLSATSVSSERLCAIRC